MSDLYTEYDVSVLWCEVRAMQQRLDPFLIAWAEMVFAIRTASERMRQQIQAVGEACQEALGEETKALPQRPRIIPCWWQPVPPPNLYVMRPAPPVWHWSPMYGRRR